MSKPRIALFGSHHSQQVAAAHAAVAAEGGIPLIFDMGLGGTNAPTLTMGQNQLSWSGVDFNTIRAIYIRSNAPNTLPAVPPVMNAGSYAEWRSPYLREQEYQASTFSFFDQLDQQGVLVINPLTKGYPDHDTKAQFYEKMRANGFPTPLTLTTNDPEAAAAFTRQFAEVVVKPAIGVGSTRLISENEPKHWEEIRHCPVMMQERIPGQTLRIHIVGDSVVLALRILSEGGVDSRSATRKFEYVRLPEQEAARIVRANRFMGLHFAAWDIIQTEDDRYCYLDCNPGAFIMWIGAELVSVVFRQLALYMITYAKTGSIQEASAAVTPWNP